MCEQVKGQRKNQKDKQDVEIRQRMTVAALASAMNKEFGEKQDKHRDSVKSNVHGFLFSRLFVFQIMWWKLCWTPLWI